MAESSGRFDTVSGEFEFLLKPDGTEKRDTMIAVDHPRPECIELSINRENLSGRREEGIKGISDGGEIGPERNSWMNVVRNNLNLLFIFVEIALEESSNFSTIHFFL